VVTTIKAHSKLGLTGALPINDYGYGLIPWLMVRLQRRWFEKMTG
jgi:hypothetical protein